MTWRTWRAAMADALYGERGFYLSAGTPAHHFRTAAHVSAHWAQAWQELASRVDRALDEPEGFCIVDVGAGGGELLAGLASSAPPRWRLVGVDVAPRPVELPGRVEWAAELPAAFTGVLVACEWLDVVPLEVVELTDDGLRVVEVDGSGTERTGGEPTDADLVWLRRWWLPAEVGDRAEVGATRDEAWAAAVARLQRGLAVAVDYPVVPERDVAGTLTGYRAGRQLAPVPDGSCDITAHVLLQACAAAAAADGSALLSQRDALRQLGIAAARPRYDGAAAAYLAALSDAGAVAELTDASGLGAFMWLVQAKGVPLPVRATLRA